MSIAVGIDIGGTNTKVALVTEQGETLSFVSLPTNSQEPFDKFISRVSETVNALIEKENLNLKNIKGIGVGCPNADSRTGNLVSPPNLKWGSVALGQKLKESFNIPILISNDANVAAFGEKRWGVAKQMSDFIVVTLGTGIGTGIFVNNQILIGGNSLAGEGGHITIFPEGRPCHCGGLGHLECYGSVRGIKQTVYELIDEDIKFREIAARFNAKEEVFIRAFEMTADFLGRGLAQMSTLFAPEAFILAGGIATIGESFADDVQKALDKYVFPAFKGHSKVHISQIATEHGAVLGAASQVFLTN